MRNLVRAYAQAWTGLQKKPGFVTTIVATMGLTMGALLCAITLNYLLILEPLPYPEQDRLFVAQHHLLGAEKEDKATAFTYPGMVHLYQTEDVFEQAAVISYNQDVVISLSSQPRVNIAYTTPEFHQMLSSPMALGRAFDQREELETYNPVAMLSHDTWQNTFGGSADILEQTINLGGVSYRIIGVLGENFVEPQIRNMGVDRQIWLPWDFNQESSWTRASFGNIDDGLTFVGQRKAEFSELQTNELMTTLVNERWQQGVSDIDFFNGWSIHITTPTLKQIVLGESESIAVMLLAGILGLMLIACANIANLFMSRTAEKQRQMAIRAAIGATKSHLFRGMLVETSILMALSVVLALAVAQVGFYIMQHYLGAVLPRVNELNLSLVTLGCGVFFAALFALGFANLSTRMINYRALNSSLQSSGKGSGLQVSKKTRQILIASQVSLATVLICANFSLLNGAVEKINMPLGFATDNIATLQLSFSSTDQLTLAETAPIMTEVMDKLSLLPQVDTVSQSGTPLDGFSLRAMTAVATGERVTPFFKVVDEHYFDMLKQPLLQGDQFTAENRPSDGSWVMIVNQSFARQLRADGDVIGMQIETGAPQHHTIIGIIRDIQLPNASVVGQRTSGYGVPRVYAPNSRSHDTFMLKLKPHQTVSREQLAEIISEVDSRYSVFSFHLAEERLGLALFAEITTAITTSVLAILVLFLAAVGLYGVLSYSTQLRRFELGARMAIGATRKHLLGLIVGDNSKAVIMGFAGSIGLFALLFMSFSGFVQSLLNWQLLAVLVLSVLLIIGVTLFACYWPLRQYFNRPAIYSLRDHE